MLTAGRLLSIQNGRPSGFITAELGAGQWDNTIGICEFLPLWQNVDNLFAHYERRIVQNACRSNTILGNRQLFIEKGFREQKKPSFEGKLSAG